MKNSTNGVIYLNPCEVNASVTAVANFLFSHLSKKDFVFLNICVSELGKQMFALELLRGVCKIEKIEEKIEEIEEEITE